MPFNRTIISLDIETTGLNPATDRIVEVGLVEWHPNGSTVERDWLVHPGRPIPPEATAIHGITDAMVADASPFALLAGLIHGHLAGRDLCGFNLFSFDLPIIWDEFNRAGVTWDLAGMRIIDAGLIFKLKEPRTLQDAFRKYANGAIGGCWHNALTDARATLAVLQGQLAAYSDLAAMSLDELATFSRGDSQRIDFAGKLVRDKDGDACFGFGVNKGQKVRDKIGYAEWMMRDDFPAETKHRLQEELDRLQEEALKMRMRPEVTEMAE